MSVISRDAIARATEQMIRDQAARQPVDDKQLPEVAETGIAKAFNAAVGAETTFGWMSRQIDQAGYAVDPEYKGVFYDPDVAAYVTQGLPESYWPQLANTVSLPHAMAVADNLREVVAMRQTLNEAGWTGVGASLLANVLDPVNYATGVATGSLSWLQTGGRVARFAKGGLANAAAAGVSEAYIATQDPERTAGAIAINLLAATAIGGGLNAIMPAKDAANIVRKTRKQAFAMGAAGSGEMTPEGRAAAMSQPVVLTAEERAAKVTATNEAANEIITGAGFNRDLDPEAHAAVVSMGSDEIVARFAGVTDGELPPSDIVAMPESKTPPPTSTGDGAEQPPKPPPRIAGDFAPMNATTAKSLGPKLIRQDLAGKLGKSDIPEVRYIASLMVDDALVRKADDGSVIARTDSGASYAVRNNDRWGAQLYRGYKPYEDMAFAKSGRPITQRYAAAEEFDRAITYAIKDPYMYETATQEVKDAADAGRELFKGVHEQNQRHDVGGSVGLDADPNYVPVIPVRPSWQKFVADYGAVPDAILEGESAATGFLYRAIKSGVEGRGGEIDDAIALNMARNIPKTILDPSRLDDLTAGRTFAGDEDAMRAFFKASLDDVDDAKIEQLMYDIFGRGEKKAGSRHYESRTPWDLNYYEHIGNNRVSFDELMDTRFQSIAAAYIRNSTAAQVSSVTFAHASEMFGHKIKTWDGLRNALKNKGASEGDLFRFDVASAGLRGAPHPGDIGGERVGRIVAADMNYQFTRTAGGFQLAQIPELGRVMWQSGVHNFIKAVPELPSTFRRAADGEIDNAVAALAETFGIGVSDSTTRRVLSSIGTYATSADKTIETVDRTLRRMGQWQSKYTGLTFINDLSKRMAIMGGYYRIPELVNSLDTERGILRLAHLGLTKEQAIRVRDIIADKANYSHVRGMDVLDPAKIADQAGFGMFITAWDNHVTSAVQRNTLGNLSGWMSANWARLILQFRTFALGGVVKQSLYAAQMRKDPATWGWMATSTMLAGLTYYARVNIASVGRKDAAEYRKKMLAPETFTPAMIANAGYSSMFPAAFDNIWTAIGAPDGVFSAARYSGLESKFGMSQFSTGESIVKGAGAVRSIGEMAFNPKTDRFTQSDFRAWRSLLPFQRAPIIRNLLDAAETRRPKSEARR